MALISIGISTYKLFYILELLFLFLIPIESFKGNKKKKIITLSSIIGISLILDLSWNFMTSLSSTIESDLVSNQISFILHHPFKYIIIFINTFINEIYYYITNLVAGSEMCYGLVRVNQLFVILYLATLVVSYFTDNEKVKIKFSGKILIGTVLLLLFGLVSTTLYLEWTAEKLGIGATVIIGIQSRYFFSLLIPLIMLFPNINKKYKNEKMLFNTSLILSGLLFINTIASLLIAVFPK